MTYTHKWNDREKCYDIMTMDLSRTVGKQVTRVEAEKTIKALHAVEREREMPKPQASESLVLVRDAVLAAGGQKKLASAIECSENAVFAWVKGVNTPSRIYKQRLKSFILEQSCREFL